MILDPLFLTLAGAWLLGFLCALFIDHVWPPPVSSEELMELRRELWLTRQRLGHTQRQLLRETTERAIAETRSVVRGRAA